MDNKKPPDPPDLFDLSPILTVTLPDDNDKDKMDSESTNRKRVATSPPSTVTNPPKHLRKETGRQIYTARDRAPYVVHVSLKDGQTSNTTLHKVKFGMFLHQKNFSNVVLGSVKQLGRNRVSVEFQSHQDANSFLISRILTQHNYIASIPQYNITRMGLVRDVPTEWSEEEIIENIKIPAACGSVIKARRLNRKRIDLDFIKNLLSNVQGPLLVMGDFNGHHYRWGSDTCDNFGSGLADLMDELDLCVINNGCATRRGSTGQNSSCVDLTFCSSNIASIFNWNRLDMTYGSDHYPIMVEIPSKSSPNATSPPLLKYQLNLVDWDLYAKILDLRVSSLPPINGANAQECFTAFSNAISATADDCFPSKKPSTGKIPSPPWWDRECSAAIRARNEAEKQLNADMNLENLINFKHVLAKSRKLLKRKKREGWRRYCDSLSPSTPASVVWRKLKSFRNSMRSPSRSMTSKELGHQFFSKLAPAYAPNKDECAYPEFQLTSDEPLDEPFTSEELNSVQRA
ncbi:hypothetical protein PYW08_013779 [Mythimna loreyi]|uniref:Uncharacterized protein n=1 Tax=Mythimna loreyi TaxID=667449 RepID=A0ACC2R898_9NEOP|nr:hypothetical protein PYW08_013779 [Mythimna loreyi]